MWKLVKDTSEQLSAVHAQFFKMLSELSREISEYNIAQKEKQKTSVKIFMQNLLWNCIHWIDVNSPSVFATPLQKIACTVRTFTS